MSGHIINIIKRLWPEPEPEPEPLVFGYRFWITVLCFLFLLCKSIDFILYRSYLRKEQRHPSLCLSAPPSEPISSGYQWLKGMQLLMHNISVFPAVGIDCEFTSVSSRGGHPEPAILQIAKENTYCAIFQLKLMKNIMTCFGRLELIKLLQNPNILKVGVGVMNDAKYLEEHYGFITRGCLDIRFLAQENYIEPRSLAYLAKEVLGVRKVSVLKSQPWESEFLTNDQIEYATKDARLGVELFIKLNERAICRHYSWLRRLFWNDKTHWKYTMKLWESFVDKHFCFGGELILNTPEIDSWFQPIPRLSCIEYWPSFFTLESVERPLICGACGTCNNTITLKAIVPLDYNVGTSDNVSPKYLNLCDTCLVKSQTLNYFLRERLTNVCGAPNPDYADKRISKAKIYAKYLLNYNNNLSEAYYKFSVTVLCNMFKFHPLKLTRELLEVIVNMDCWPESEHGCFVSEFYAKFYMFDFINLDLIWCAAFVNSIKPTHLPHNWLRYCDSNDIYSLNPHSLDLGLFEKYA